MMFQNVSIPLTHCLDGSVECCGFMRKILSIMFYHLGHFADRLLWFNSPTNEWYEDKLADLYQWAMWKSVEYDDNYEVWKYKLK